MRRIVAVALLVFAGVAPFIFSPFHIFQLTQLMVYAIALVGLSLLTGVNGQVSLGHGAFYAFGAYAAAILITHAGFPYWAAVPAAGVVCFLVGLLLGYPALRLEGIYLALATFSLAIATPQILKLDALSPWTGGVQGLVLDKPESPIESLLDADRWIYAFTLAITILAVLAAWNLVRGRTGRALIAIRDHPIAAATMGVDLARYKTMTFAFSALYTGVAGALGALAAGFVSPDSFTIVLSIQLLVGVVVGGIGSILGMFIGAAFIELVPNVAEKISDAAPSAIYGAVLIGSMIVRALLSRRGGRHVDS